MFPFFVTTEDFDTTKKVNASLYKNPPRLSINLSRLPYIANEKHVKELNSEGILLEHKKTGARVFLLSNDDENKVFCIGFRTPPSDSTGVPHIMEHSVLCGSAPLQTAPFYEGNEVGGTSQNPFGPKPGFGAK